MSEEKDHHHSNLNPDRMEEKVPNHKPTADSEKMLPLDSEIITEKKAVKLIASNTPSHIIGIGASAGGLEAIETFFENMPSNTNLAFVVIQHLSPAHKSMMVELLSKRTEMPVYRAVEGVKIKVNCIYMIPPKMNLTIFHGQLFLQHQEDHPRGVNLPIDIFFRSLAEDQEDRAIGIILSGTGSDGTRGVRAIKEKGGMVMVQTEETAKFNGMPRSAIATGHVDYITSPSEMPKQLLSYTKHPFTAKAQRSETILSDEDTINRIFAKVREKTKVDFTLYKPSTVLRRIERRMTINQIHDLRDYSRFIEHSPSEANVLYRDLLIGVTNFFRDPNAFADLQDNYIPEIILRENSKEIRIWVAGCSTGEEAYSLAILFREAMDKLKKDIDIKIFATDIDQVAIIKAGNGIFPESIVADIAPNLLAKYFSRSGENFAIVRNIREMVVFAQHNLIKDPPFTNINMISCRNLLIYLQPILQKKVLEYFNFSLKAEGILFLGSSETIGDMNEYFENLNQKNKIFKSKGRRKVTDIGDTPIVRSGDSTNYFARKLHSEGGFRHDRLHDDRFMDRLLQTLSPDYIPLALIINENHEVIYSLGETEGLMRVPSGKMTNNIIRMAHKELAIPLATGLQKVFKLNEEIKYNNIRIQVNHQPSIVAMHIKPILSKKGQESLAVVLMTKKFVGVEEEGQQQVQGYDLGRDAQQHIQDLEQELQFTKESLQATVEELETSNEELQATNEELLSSNEELQSTNEELQSVNEELHTVNSEYQNKIMELTELNNDMDNLLATTQTAILFLDENLEIRSFTPKIRDILNIMDNDQGRPFAHISHNLEINNLFEMAQKTLDEAIPQEMQVSTKSGIWYSLKILPYQISPERYSGVLMHFIDITALKKSQEDLLKNEERRKLSQRIGGYGTWDWDIKNNSIIWSENLHEIYSFNPDHHENSLSAYLEFIHPSDQDFVRESLELAIRNKIEFNVEHRIIRKDKSVRWVHEIGSPFFDKNGNPERMLGVARDITDTKEFERALQLQQDLNDTIVASIDQGIILYDNNLDILLWNQYMEHFTGLGAAKVLGKNAQRDFPGLQEAGILDKLHQALAGESCSANNSYFTDPTTGKKKNYIGKYQPHLDSEGKIVGVLATIIDCQDT